MPNTSVNPLTLTIELGFYSIYEVHCHYITPSVCGLAHQLKVPLYLCVLALYVLLAVGTGNLGHIHLQLTRTQSHWPCICVDA